ncbi:MAG: TolC family outer membrane protein [Alphaproteobacteria bacterium]|nr:TolC family outer membrane protein [Alphaproteobacteria bacterium]MDE2336073.1 TolC family outer membrane protein [Alphaproteobacteria bacterium]
MAPAKQAALPAKAVAAKTLPAKTAPAKTHRRHRRQLSDAAPPRGPWMSLSQALGLTYADNPQIKAARAQLKSVDETYAQAVSGFRPSVTGSASYQAGTLDGNSTGTTRDNPKAVALAVSEPLYSGGTTLASMKAAKKRVVAARAALDATGQTVLLQAATYFMDTARDRLTVRLEDDNVHALDRQLHAARERLRHGTVTMTDVRQAEARLSAAVAARAQAEASLRESRAALLSVSGVDTDDLLWPKSDDLKPPATLEAAVAAAQRDNPDLSAARLAVDAAAADRRAVAGTALPQVNLVGQVGRNFDNPSELPDSQVDQASVMLTATFPFYTGGDTDSRVRQARDVEEQRRMELGGTALTVRRQVTDAWENLLAAKAEDAAYGIQIGATRAALAGVKTEARVGTRTTLDILNAEQEYIGAEIARAGAEHDRVVALYALFAAMGSLDPATLRLKDAYDPAAHFKKVRHKWFGTAAVD